MSASNIPIGSLVSAIIYTYNGSFIITGYLKDTSESHSTVNSISLTSIFNNKTVPYKGTWYCSIENVTLISADLDTSREYSNILYNL